MSLNKLCEKVISETVCKIITSTLRKDVGAERQCFRVKNLGKDEILAFLEAWEIESSGYGLEGIQVIVSGDSDKAFPNQYRADPGRSITWYRNNNNNGLIYVETKSESDEQGLKNIFTLQDRNFLDGYFSDEIDVPETIVALAWVASGGSESDKPALLSQYLIEALNYLHPGLTQIPVRNFIRFVLDCFSNRRKNTESLNSNQLHELVGKSLIYLNLFTDEYWRSDGSSARVSRRLELNLSYADLVMPNNVDIKLEDIELKCSTIIFVDLNGQEYPGREQEKWKQLCLNYCSHATVDLRGQIPLRIFEQLFAKDVKGLKLGDLVEQEITDSQPARLGEYNGLNVKDGLNKRLQGDALVFLEADPIDGEQPLVDNLTDQTRRKVEKIAYPSSENFLNPLTKLAEIAMDLRSSYSEEEACKLEINLADGVQKDSPTIGLFAFIYGPSLRSAVEASLLSPGGFELTVDERLLTIVPPPALLDLKEDEDQGENELLEWSPIPIEFLLVSSKDGHVLDKSTNHEWLPDYYPYLVLLWLGLAARDAPTFNQVLTVPIDISLDEWLVNVSARVLGLNECCDSFSHELIASDALLTRLEDCFSQFTSQIGVTGLKRELLNELIDIWAEIAQQAKVDFLPSGNIDGRLEYFLSRDIIKLPGSDDLLMLASHPIRLRWIVDYLCESESLANQALAGDLRLNKQNDKFYLNWISGLSPHQQPPVAVSSARTLLFASGERGWCEEFTSLDARTKVSRESILDYASLNEMAEQVSAYLEAHPYKQDGLKLLLVLQRGGKLVSELIRKVRQGNNKESRIEIHVLAPMALWEDIITNFEKLPTENRISEGNRLFPPLQLRLYEFKINADLAAMVGQQRFDIALVPRLLGGQIVMQHNTEPSDERKGKFDPLLDNPSSVVGGNQGGEISVVMIPRNADSMMNDWSTLAIRHSRSSAVSQQQPENTDYIALKISFQDTARLYSELHRQSHWVVILERYISREQIESLEPQPDILTLRENVGANGLYTLIVSSNAGKGFIVNRLQRKLNKISMSDGSVFTQERSGQLAEKIYEETRKISPRLVLQAMGISRVTEEILGLMIAVHLADVLHPAKPENGVVVWISLDEHLEWFNGSNSTRADLCRITLEIGDEGLNVDVLIVEGKFRKNYDPHGVEQVKSSIELFKSITSPTAADEELIDARLWREQLLSAMENVNPEARHCMGSAADEVLDHKYKLPEIIRSDFREGEFKLNSLSGLYSICCHLEAGELKENSDGNVHILKSYRNQMLELVAGGDIEATKSITIDGDQNLGAIDESRDGGFSSPDKVDEFGVKDIPTHSTESIGPEKAPQITGLDETDTRGKLTEQDLVTRYQMVLDKFGEFGVNVQQPEDKTLRYVEGPASILYRVKPGQAVDPRRIYEKADVLKLALALDQGQNIRFGNHKGYVTIDVPKNNSDRYFVDALDMWARWQRPADELAAPLGEDSYGNIVEINFSSSNSPHLLIGGTTGSGKSEALTTLLEGMIRYYNPDELRLMLVDPKGTELQQYENSEHLEGTIGWDDSDTIELLERAVHEMQNRYLKLKEQHTRSLPEYNSKVGKNKRIPWWVVVLDEYADLTSDRDSKKLIESHLKRLAQKARAAGIHVIIATQKPSSEVISTNLRSNLPAQLALKVKSSIESRVIIDEVGAETLNGMGDALFKAEGKLTRVQCAKT